MENKPKTLFKLEIKEAENDSRGRQVFINGKEVKYVEKYTVAHTEAAYLISRGLREATPWSKDGGETIAITHGCGEENSKIPPCYQRGNYFTMIEYRNGPDDSCPEYSLVIC